MILPAYTGGKNQTILSSGNVNVPLGNDFCLLNYPTVKLLTGGIKEPSQWYK